MVSRSNRRFHDRVSSRYDSLYDSPYWRFYREISWRHLKGYLPGTRPALAADLGCGTGWFGRRLLKSGFDVVFLDPSSGMLERCRSLVEAQGSRGRELRFVLGELEDLGEIATGSLLFATAQGDPLSFCEDPARALAELRRTLVPGAHLVLSVDSRVAGVRSLLERPTPDAALELLRTGRTQWPAQRPDETFPMKMFDPDELGKLLAKAGFTVQSQIAKTCLVQRSNESWLADRERRRALLRAEEAVHGKAAWFGLAGHFQIAARRR